MPEADFSSPVAMDEAAWYAMTSAIASDDVVGFQKLFQDGRVFSLAAGTEIQILSAKDDRYEIFVQDGPRAGVTGWVLRERVTGEYEKPVEDRDEAANMAESSEPSELSEEPGVGKTVLMPDSPYVSPVAVDQAAWDAMAAAMLAQDNAAYSWLVTDGRVFLLQANTKITIIDAQDIRYWIRVEDGPHEGKSGWIPQVEVTGELL